MSSLQLWFALRQHNAAARTLVKLPKHSDNADFVCSFAAFARCSASRNDRGAPSRRVSQRFWRAHAVAPHLHLPLLVQASTPVSQHQATRSSEEMLAAQTRTWSCSMHRLALQRLSTQQALRTP